MNCKKSISFDSQGITNSTFPDEMGGTVIAVTRFVLDGARSGRYHDKHEIVDGETTLGVADRQRGKEDREPDVENILSRVAPDPRRASERFERWTAARMLSLHRRSHRLRPDSERFRGALR